MSQTRVFYSGNTLFIDGIRLPIPAGSLYARLMSDGTTVSIMKNGSTDSIVFRAYSEIQDINGGNFPDPTSCIAYLAAQFAMRRPIADAVSSEFPITAVGQTQFNLQVPPQYFVTVRANLNGIEYRPPSIGVSSTTLTWLRDDIVLEPSDEFIITYA